MFESCMDPRTESTQTETHAYVGQELELFAHAENWKRYWAGVVQEYLRGDVLEVGAGIGANTRLLLGAHSGEIRRWVSLEPDARLLEQLRSLALTRVEPRLGTLANLGADELFDAILYIDVLEHIEDHIGEIRRATAHLRPRGHLVVLSPAHQWLFSEFDAAIGHYRRYTRQSLKAVAQGITSLRLERLWYLDACGLLASAANRLFLRQSSPTLRQILFWDRSLVRCSRLIDPLIGHRVGKSVLGIWVRQND
jgi:2-polyprenyl-3-methyl-5-hydroxy-6-metoxy-1,4-benzoquinol methylase